MEKLYELISSIINVPVEKLTPLSGPENLAEWDSLAQIGILAAVEESYRVQLTMQEMLSIKTIADLRSTLEELGVLLVDAIPRG